MNIGTWLKETHQKVNDISETGSLDAQVLLSSILHKPRSWVLAHLEYELSETDISHLDEMLTQLERSIPLAYIIGTSNFYGLEFYITTDVLIPRPETELLVEKALLWSQNHKFSGVVLDIGTGSGCIAISIAAHQPGIKCIGIDNSMAALKVAKRNSVLNQVQNRCSFIHSDLTTSLGGKFQLICANLPYIPSHKLENLQVAKNEPIAALNGGNDGLDVIRRLLMDSVRISASEVCLLLEIEAGQGAAAKDLANKYYPSTEIKIEKDLAGNDRLLIIERL